MIEDETEKSILEGCGEDYCGKFMYQHDKTKWDTLCSICKAKLGQHKDTKKLIIREIQRYNEKKYGHCKDSCESQEYDAINFMLKELFALHESKDDNNVKEVYE